ncbi:threonine ammonia-lyase [Telmatospirillum sp. J64-1]|uniref:threonine ammonia-lyase n=1 Tax=Telmatospirillum sp. J64-1 TaxID=2502183 RepID=UPI00115F6C41|nr:threonine ammonia-lyase [Telmatospirillum sp. J64-1]
MTLSDVQEAAAKLQGTVLRTPLVAAPALSAALGAEIWLKLENFQFSGSFKARGALVKLLSLDQAQRQAGVVAMSAGNHAQGVALHAGRLGIPALIVMPLATPFTKVEQTRHLGARVVLHGETLSEAQAHARQLAERDGLVFVHPYDDPQIIAGQGTVALEMLEDQPELEDVVIPIGGGGLAAGMALAAKALKPSLRLWGVQSALYPSMLPGGSVMPAGGPTIAEGIAVKTPGRLTRPIIEEHLEDVLTVGEAALERAVQMLVEKQKLVAEGAGAAPLAALLEHPGRFAGRKLGLVVSGGNIDSRILASVMMRGLIRAGRMARLRIEIADAPGLLARVAQVIGAEGGNIIEIYHQRLFHDVPVKFAELDVVVETTGHEQLQAVIASLTRAGWRVRQLGNTTLDG